MHFSFTAAVLSFVCILATTNAQEDKNRTWTLRGRVVDQQGKPVNGADVATFWSANGRTSEEVRALSQEQNWDEVWSREGQMRPWGQHPTKTDSRGSFVLAVSGGHYKLMALDSDRSRGGVILFDPYDDKQKITLTVKPLVRVFGKVRLRSNDEPLNFTHVRVEAVDHPTIPLGINDLIGCGSVQSRFEFLVPPGIFVVSASTDDPEAETVPRQVIAVPDDVQELDLGVLRLVPRPSRDAKIAEAKQTGTWTDLRENYGKPAPAWFITDARGLGKNASVEDFKGKWLLLYFWAPS